MSFKAFNALLSNEGTGVDKESTASLRPWILVIDDDPTVRKSLEAVLRDRYQILLCASAAQGVEALHADISTAILDVKMKGHDGFWACDQIRKRLPDLPVIFYSAYQDVKNPYDIINDHRPFAYILKDGDPKRLLNSVDLAVSLYKVVLSAKKLSESTGVASGPTDFNTGSK